MESSLVKSTLNTLNSQDGIHAENTISNFQKHYKDILAIRIRNKYNTYQIPNQKILKYHTLTFLRDYKKIKPWLLGCDKNYDTVLGTLIKNSTQATGISKQTHTDFVTQDNNIAACCMKIGQDYNSLICMKGVFEDEAGIFLHYAGSEGGFRAIIKEARNEAPVIEDNILEIWVAAIKAGLPGYPSDII